MRKESDPAVRTVHSGACSAMESFERARPSDIRLISTSSRRKKSEQMPPRTPTAVVSLPLLPESPYLSALSRRDAIESVKARKSGLDPSAPKAFDITRGYRNLENALDDGDAETSCASGSPSERMVQMMNEAYLALRDQCQEQRGRGLTIGAYRSKFLSTGQARKFVPYTGVAMVNDDCQYIAHGPGSIELGTGDRYHGEFKRGKLTGSGERFYGTTGNRYTGEFVEGEPDGRGRMTYARHPTLVSYEGGWRLGQHHGQGTLAYKDGSVYVGGLHFHKISGPGHFKSIDGLEYKGQYDGGKCNGGGKCWYPDGRVYDGSWKDGLRHGIGRMTSPSGVEYNGSWEQDSPAGFPIRLTWAGGSKTLHLPLGCAVHIAVAIQNSRQETMYGDTGRTLTIASYRRIQTRDKQWPRDKKENADQRLIAKKLGYHVTTTKMSTYTLPPKPEKLKSENVITLEDPFPPVPIKPAPRPERAPKKRTTLVGRKVSRAPMLASISETAAAPLPSISEVAAAPPPPDPPRPSPPKPVVDLDPRDARRRVRRNFAGAHTHLRDVLANLEKSVKHVIAADPDMHRLDVLFEYAKFESERLLRLGPVEGGVIKNGCCVFPSVFLQPHDTINHRYKDTKVTEDCCTDDGLELSGDDNVTGDTTKISVPRAAQLEGMEFDPFSFFRMRYAAEWSGSSIRPPAYGQAGPGATVDWVQAFGHTVPLFPEGSDPKVSVPTGPDADDGLAVATAGDVFEALHADSGGGRSAQVYAFNTKRISRPRARRLDVARVPPSSDRLPPLLPRITYRSIRASEFRADRGDERESAWIGPPTTAAAAARRPQEPVRIRWQAGLRVRTLASPRPRRKAQRLLRPDAHNCFRKGDYLDPDIPWSWKYVPPSPFIDSMFCSEGDYIIVVKDVTEGLLPYGERFEPCLIHVQVKRDRSSLPPSMPAESAVVPEASAAQQATPKSSATSATTTGSNNATTTAAAADTPAPDDPGLLFGGPQPTPPSSGNEGDDVTSQDDDDDNRAPRSYLAENLATLQEHDLDAAAYDPALLDEKVLAVDADSKEVTFATPPPSPAPPSPRSPPPPSTVRTPDLNAADFADAIVTRRSLLTQFAVERAAAEPRRDHDAPSRFDWRRFGAAQYRRAWLAFVHYHSVHLFNKHRGNEELMLRDAWAMFQADYCREYGASVDEDSRRMTYDFGPPAFMVTDNWECSDVYQRDWPRWFASREDMEAHVGTNDRVAEHLRCFPLEMRKYR